MNEFNEHAQPAPAYTFLNADVSGDNFTQLLGINDFNNVVGYHGQNVNQGEMLTLPSTFTPDNFPGSAQTQVVGISNTGHTDGFYVDQSGVTHGFTAFNGAFNTVDAPNSAFTQLLGINDFGQEVGYSSTDPAGMVNQRAFVVQPNGHVDYLHLPTNVNSQATGINDLGEVVGFIQPTATTFEGFISVDGHTHLLQAPGATSTQALGVNNLGQVVGDYTDAHGNLNGFIYSHGKFTTVDAPGATQTTINGINDLGNIVGFDMTPDGVTHGLVGSPLEGLGNGGRFAQELARDLIPGLNGIGDKGGNAGWSGSDQPSLGHLGGPIDPPFGMQGFGGITPHHG